MTAVPRYLVRGLWAALPAALLVACSSEPPTASLPAIDSSLVASAAVTPDPARTYEYDVGTVRVDSVLRALWRAGLSVAVAWLPVQYLCEDLRGPRLTVELAAPDDRMAQHDFAPGTGRLQCSEQLWQYSVPPEPGLAATVRFVEIEGGCWMLLAADGRRFEPVGLPDAFRVDGLRVRVTLQSRPDMASVCMIAPLAEVLAIRRR